MSNLLKETRNINRDYVFQKLDISNDNPNIAYIGSIYFFKDKQITEKEAKELMKNPATKKMVTIKNREMREDMDGLVKSIISEGTIIQHPNIKNPFMNFGDKYDYKVNIPYQYDIMNIPADTTAQFGNTINFSITENIINLTSLKLHLTLNAFGDGIADRLTTSGILGLISEISMFIDNTHNLGTIYNSSLLHMDYFTEDAEHKAILLSNASVNKPLVDLIAEGAVITEYSLPFSCLLTKVFSDKKRDLEPCLKLRGNSQFTIRIKFNSVGDSFLSYTTDPQMSNVKLTYEFAHVSPNTKILHNANLFNHVQKYVLPVRQVEKYLLSAGSINYSYVMTGIAGSLFAIIISLHKKAEYDLKDRLNLIADELTEVILTENSQEIFSYKTANAQNMIELYSKSMLGHALPANVILIPIGGNHSEYKENFENIHSTQYFENTSTYQLSLKFSANLAQDSYLNITYLQHDFIHSALGTYNIIK